MAAKPRDTTSGFKIGCRDWCKADEKVEVTYKKTKRKLDSWNPAVAEMAA